MTHGEQVYHHPAEPTEVHHPVDDDVLDLAQRIRTAMNGADINYDVLQELAADPARKEYFDQMLDDLTTEAVMMDPEFVANIKKLRESPSKLHDHEIRERQREIFAQHKDAVLAQAGISSEQATSQMEQYKKSIKEQVKGILAARVEADPTPDTLTVLEGLGIVRFDDGKEQYVYPEGLFPESVDRKWQIYLSVVADHLKKVNELKMGIGQTSQEDVVADDRARRLAHNSVAKDIHYLLGLDKLAEEDWDFTQTRKLLDKMRDNVFSGIDVSEKALIDLAVAKGSAGHHAVQALTRIAKKQHPSARGKKV